MMTESSYKYKHTDIFLITDGLSNTEGLNTIDSLEHNRLYGHKNKNSLTYGLLIRTW